MVGEPNNNQLINIAICGRNFTETGAPLDSSLNVISGYREGFQYCLNVSSKKFTTAEIPLIVPSIRLQAATIGSLDVTTVIDFAMTAAIGVSINPDISAWIQWSWELYQKSSELISFATAFFNREQVPVTIRIENSPGARPFVMVMAAGRDICTTSEVYDVAKNIHKHFSNIASEVVNGRAERIRISPGIDNNTPFVLDATNKNNFSVKSREKDDHEPIEFRCGLYSFNKHSKSGKLQFLEDSESTVFAFVIDGEQDIDAYIDGLKAHYSIIKATREMQINALGETKIKRLHITDIQNYWE